MSNRRKPLIRGLNLKGIQNAQISVGALVHKKPELVFELPVQVSVDEDGYVVPDGTPGAITEIKAAEFYFQIDPKKLTPRHQNSVQAVRDRITAAQRIMEKVALATNAAANVGGAPVSRVTRADLPDADLLTDLYGELDEAMDARLLDLVTVDENGLTNWNYETESGEVPQLSQQLLSSFPRLAEAMQTALQKWLNFTSQSSKADTKQKTENGTKDSTTKTPTVSSTESPTPSIVPEKSEPIISG